MTPGEVGEVERLVNTWVLQATPTVTRVMGLAVSAHRLVPSLPPPRSHAACRQQRRPRHWCCGVGKGKGHERRRPPLARVVLLARGMRT